MLVLAPENNSELIIVATDSDRVLVSVRDVYVSCSPPRVLQTRGFNSNLIGEIKPVAV